MPPEKQDEAYLWDMLDAAQAIQRFVEGRSSQDYVADRLLRSAVERNVEIIGEAARGVSAQFQVAHAEISWRASIAQRNVIAHEYGEIDDQRLWIVATRFIPELIDQLEPLVPPSE
ncbi:MAG: DUF86 domain-containing protein [Phycisphaerae bacterium]|nr:DUF86 domain-containing protein [Phycisphaerae bacterium]